MAHISNAYYDPLSVLPVYCNNNNFGQMDSWVRLEDLNYLMKFRGNEVINFLSNINNTNFNYGHIFSLSHCVFFNLNTQTYEGFMFSGVNLDNYYNILTFHEQQMIQMRTEPNSATLMEPTTTHMTTSSDNSSLTLSTSKQTSLNEIEEKIPQQHRMLLAFFTYTRHDRHYIKIMRAQKRLIDRYTTIIDRIAMGNFELPAYLSASPWLQYNARKLHTIECENAKEQWNVFFNSYPSKFFSTSLTTLTTNTTLLLLTRDEVCEKYKRMNADLIYADVFSLNELMDSAFITPENFIDFIKLHF